jgi:hypothetical protein
VRGHTKLPICFDVLQGVVIAFKSPCPPTVHGTKEVQQLPEMKTKMVRGLDFRLFIQTYKSSKVSLHVKHVITYIFLRRGSHVGNMSSSNEMHVVGEHLGFASPFETPKSDQGDDEVYAADRAPLVGTGCSCFRAETCWSRRDE